MSEHDENKVTSVAGYRKLVGVEKTVTVPSGATFTIRQLSVMDYIKGGLEDIPNEFFAFIAELSAGVVKQADTEEVKKNYELFEKYLRITVEQGIVNPPVTLKYEKGKADTHLVYAELSHADQVYLIDSITGRRNV